MNSISKERLQLYSLLGKLPPRDQAFSIRTRREEDGPHYRTERIELTIPNRPPIPGVLTLPHQPTEVRSPALLYNHSHGGDYSLGKEELLQGREYLFTIPPAIDLARRGYVTLAIDHHCFGERSQTTESALFKEMLWKGEVLWGAMVYDSLKALDYLSTRSDVDPDRIGTVGMSMGSTMAWWLGALEPKISVVVDICCLTDFHTLIEEQNLDLHGVYYYVPRLLEEFTTTKINQLIAPRPHLAIAGIRDPLTPTRGLDRIESELKETYKKLGSEDKFQLLRYDVEHQETSEARTAWLDFIDRWLK